MLDGRIAEHRLGLRRLRALALPPVCRRMSREGHRLQLHSRGLMPESPQQVRRQAEHCRDLANGIIDDRTRLILNDMAQEYDEQARQLTRRSLASADL